MIDDIDNKILCIMQKNARVSNADIARKIGMAPSAVLERIRKLEERGIIRGYELRLNPKAVGLGLLAFIFVKTNDSYGSMTSAESLAGLPEVLEVYHLAGEDCFLIKVRAKDTESLGRFLRDKVSEIETVTSTRTTIVLETLKETLQLPLTQNKGDE